MPVKKLKDFLDNQNIKYVTISHSPTYTAQEIAASAHIPGKVMAKTVMVKIDGKMAMAVLPASCKVDFDLLKKAAGASTVGLASEQEFKNLFPECEIGAMPPFGNLYGIEV
ncbi:MAG TPA: YbaK/EbsC family protein, partial [Thermodesulfobacteriota bacterium]|nr:YbaK/EbsC family protein [Thermodesulfobacteriota bacterium]